MMKNWRKRNTSVILALVMAAVLMLFAVPAYAAEGSPVNSADELKNAFKEGGTFYLADDIGLTFGKDTNVCVDKVTLNLDLNGHTITFAGDTEYSAIDVRGGGKLYLSDSKGGGKIEQESGAKYDRAFDVSDSGSLLCMNGGMITGFTNDTDSNGPVNGGAVIVKKAGSFEMTGGKITNCKGTNGGAVYVTSDNSTFRMSGGEITNCSARNGGGVYGNGYEQGTGGQSGHRYENVSLTMTGGEIKGNTATSWGGGVYDGEYVSFTMTGGKISGNNSGSSSSGDNGCGMFVNDYGVFTMAGGEISGNIRDGVLVMGANSVTLGGTAKIAGNGSGSNANLYLSSSYQKGIAIGNGTNGASRPAAGMEIWLSPSASDITDSTAQPGDEAYFHSDNEYVLLRYDADGKKIVAIPAAAELIRAQKTIGFYATLGDAVEAAEHGDTVALIRKNGEQVTVSKEIIVKKNGQTFTGKINAGEHYTVTEIDDGWKVQKTKYTVTLSNGEGSGQTSVQATYGDKLPDVTVPAWENHIFEGYFTEQNGGGDRYIDENGKGVKEWDKDSNDVTLYACWQDGAKVESMDLLLGGDIGMRYHVAVNDPALRKNGAATVSIGSKKPSSITKTFSEASKDTSGRGVFPFNVSSVQMAEPVTVEFKDGNNKNVTSASRSIEDYYGLIKDNPSVTDAQKEMVRALVNYGYYAQQALSKTRGWTIGTDYAASSRHGDLISTAEDLEAYKPVISGTGDDVKDIQLSLLLDSETTLCVYVETKNGDAPAVTVDGETVSPEKQSDSRWLVRISNIDALNLSTIHTVTANGYTVRLSALSYAAATEDSDTIDAMRALRDYSLATLKANGKQVLTSATAEQSEYDYTGKAVSPAVTAYAGKEAVTGCDVTWSGNLTDAGIYTGVVTKEGYVGGVTVKVTIKAKKVEVPAAVEGLVYTGSIRTGVIGGEGYTLTGHTATDAGSYTATAALSSTNYRWADETIEPKTIEWSIAKKPIAVPTAISGLVYTGSIQTGVNSGEGYTLTGHTATDAGSYTATAALSSTNYCWTDETIEPKTIEWRIDKADPTVKDSVTVTYNPNGGSATFIGSMNVEGKFNYDPSNGTTFTPNDTQNYNTVSVKADVTERPVDCLAECTLSRFRKDRGDYVYKLCKACNLYAVCMVKESDCHSTKGKGIKKAVVVFKNPRGLFPWMRLLVLLVPDVPFIKGKHHGLV